MAFFSRSHVPAKIEDNFVDTCGIPIWKVQFSLLVAFLRSANSKGKIYLIWYERILHSSSSIVVIILQRVLPKIMPYSPKKFHHFRKSAAYVKGLHSGIKCHCLKIILYLSQGGYIIWRKTPFYTLFKKYHTPLIKGPLIKGPSYT